MLCVNFPGMSVAEISHEDYHVGLCMGQFIAHIFDMLREAHAVSTNSIYAVLYMVGGDQWRAPPDQQLLRHRETTQFLWHVVANDLAAIHDFVLTIRQSLIPNWVQVIFDKSIVFVVTIRLAVITCVITDPPTRDWLFLGNSLRKYQA